MKLRKNFLSLTMCLFFSAIISPSHAMNNDDEKGKSSIPSTPKITGSSTGGDGSTVIVIREAGTGGR